LPQFEGYAKTLSREVISSDNSSAIVVVSIGVDTTLPEAVLFADEMWIAAQRLRYSGVVVSQSGMASFLTLMQASGEVRTVVCCACWSCSYDMHSREI
jgi:hypothetical protein